ncbi:DUF2523 domain-containing protein [Acinetobacter bouvetii]|uniref:DUF2523 domain-containing protein n=1 Tax=Acinetobacter bouvetii TaxID=202951 RepID=A0A4Q7AQI2_9GAMM|nr:DUF2523 family protein [Acinetobacter bouvetii]RZG63681.1 DUF2523 domain-containing protein [Acinetobacter bouvetii]
MPLLINVLRFFAFNAIGWLLAGAGIAFVSYQGVTFLNDQILDYMNQRFNSIDPTTSNIFFMMGIPQGLSLWFSGNVLGMSIMSARLALSKIK